MTSLPDPCQYARDRHKNFLLWRNLWTVLLFSFGATVVATLVITIAFGRDGKLLEAAASTLGAVAGGVAIKWVVDRRADAKAEEEESWKDVKDACRAVVSDHPASPDPRQKLRLFGRWL